MPAANGSTWMVTFGRAATATSRSSWPSWIAAPSGEPGGVADRRSTASSITADKRQPRPGVAVLRGLPAAAGRPGPAGSTSCGGRGLPGGQHHLPDVVGRHQQRVRDDRAVTATAPAIRPPAGADRRSRRTANRRRRPTSPSLGRPAPAGAGTRPARPAAGRARSAGRDPCGLIPMRPVSIRDTLDADQPSSLATSLPASAAPTLRLPQFTRKPTFPHRRRLRLGHAARRSCRRADPSTECDPPCNIAITLSP